MSVKKFKQTLMGIVLVMGLPGSGKTFFAERLAARFGGVHISSDGVRKEIMASGKYSTRQKLIIYEEMSRRASRFIAEGKIPVIDATFHRVSMRDIFVRIARETGVRVNFIMVEATESLIVNRLQHRKTDSEADFAVYQKIKSEFEPLSSAHLTLMSTDDNIENMLAKAIDYLRQ